MDSVLTECAVRLYGPASGSNTANNIEITLYVEIESGTIPEPEPIVVNAEWNYGALKEAGLCGDIPPMEAESILVDSATLRIYPEGAYRTDYSYECGVPINGIWSDPPTDTVSVDLEESGLYQGEYNIYLTGFSHPLLVENTNAQLDIQVRITIDGKELPTTLRAYNYDGGG